MNWVEKAYSTNENIEKCNFCLIDICPFGGCGLKFCPDYSCKWDVCFIWFSNKDDENF